MGAWETDYIGAETEQLTLEHEIEDLEVCSNFFFLSFFPGKCAKENVDTDTKTVWLYHFVLKRKMADVDVWKTRIGEIQQELSFSKN
jgi:ATP-binding cassette subfamily D (ALD) long-chain fatty acid import protein